jgi:hypothetical protein
MGGTRRSSGSGLRVPSGSAAEPTVAYAVVPRGVPFVNEGRFWVGGRLAKRMPRLMITADAVAGGVDLWFCDREWQVRQASHSSSIAEAKRFAESLYRGLAPRWVDRRVTRRSAKRYLRQLGLSEGCSFCLRAPAEHGGAQMHGKTARICWRCITEFYDIVKGQKRLGRRRTSGIWTPPVK